MFREYPDVLTVPNVQKILRIGHNTVYSLILSGKLYALKVGKSYRIPKVKVIDYLVGKDVKANVVFEGKIVNYLFKNVAQSRVLVMMLFFLGMYQMIGLW
jgi:excisionase family DNA binding protein